MDRVTPRLTPARLVRTATATLVLAMLLVAARCVPALASAGTTAPAHSRPASAPAHSRPGSEPSGGAGLGGPSATQPPSHTLPPPTHGGKVPPPPGKRAKGAWLRRVTITEYWPSPEAWFIGALVAAPGLRGKHRIDWLYSAEGLSMQGEGLGADGRMYHINALGNGGWITSSGAPTDPLTGWSGGSPFWRAGGYWRNRRGGVTFPLLAGGWYAGLGRHYVPLPGVSFASGASLPLRFYQSIAVDPNLIPLGSRVYVPAYRHDGHGGWFLAQDTGGAIIGRHIDVFRSPPASSSDGGQLLTNQRIFVETPGQ